MRTYVKNHIHQLFPCPSGLTVVYKITDKARKEETVANEGLDPALVAEYRSPEICAFPVQSYALIDRIIMRDTDNVELRRYRSVEPLIYVSSDALMVLRDLDEPDSGGLMVLADLDPDWRSPMERDLIRSYFYDGLYLNGTPYLDVAALPFTP